MTLELTPAQRHEATVLKTLCLRVLSGGRGAGGRACAHSEGTRAAPGANAVPTTAAGAFAIRLPACAPSDMAASPTARSTACETED